MAGGVASAGIQHLREHMDASLANVHTDVTKLKSRQAYFDGKLAAIQSSLDALLVNFNNQKGSLKDHLGG